jgi:hypothetical protein
MPPKAARDDKEERLEAEEADFETSKGVNVVATFDGMKLREELLRGIYAYGRSPRDRVCRFGAKHKGLWCSVIEST